MKPLVDNFGRQHTYLRISVTDRCNLRCVYCMPHTGIELRERSEILTFDEIERVAKLFASMGVNKIRLTGGEPLVRKDLPKLIAKLATIPGIQTIGMTTNGVLLKDFAQELKYAGLIHLNVSLDSLRPLRFNKITLRNNFSDVIAGVDAALAIGFSPLKLNVVVMGGVNDDELHDFVEFVKDNPINVRFIEYMPFKFNQWNQAKFVPFQQMMEIISVKYELQPIISIDHKSVAKDYCINGLMGTISFITSMSDHFCGTCNRIRLTADGSIKSCLFHPAEINLRSALRQNVSDDILADMIQSAISAKPYGHPSAEELVKIENRSMIQIGG